MEEGRGQETIDGRKKINARGIVGLTSRTGGKSRGLSNKGRLLQGEKRACGTLSVDLDSPFYTQFFTWNRGHL
jgi:hypothetical protein